MKAIFDCEWEINISVLERGFATWDACILDDIGLNGGTTLKPHKIFSSKSSAKRNVLKWLKINKIKKWRFTE